MARTCRQNRPSATPHVGTPTSTNSTKPDSGCADTHTLTPLLGGRPPAAKRPSMTRCLPHQLHCIHGQVHHTHRVRLGGGGRGSSASHVIRYRHMIQHATAAMLLLPVRVQGRTFPKSTADPCLPLPQHSFAAAGTTASAPRGTRLPLHSQAQFALLLLLLAVLRHHHCWGHCMSTLHHCSGVPL